jgi:hypothetical protein
MEEGSGQKRCAPSFRPSTLPLVGGSDQGRSFRRQSGLRGRGWKLYLAMQLQLICQLFDAGNKPWRSGKLQQQRLSGPRSRRGGNLFKMIRFMPFDSILLSPALCCRCSDVLPSRGPARGTLLRFGKVASGLLDVIQGAVTSQCRGQNLAGRDDAGCLSVQSVAAAGQQPRGKLTLPEPL